MLPVVRNQLLAGVPDGVEDAAQDRSDVDRAAAEFPDRAGDDLVEVGGDPQAVELQAIPVEGQVPRDDGSAGDTGHLVELNQQACFVQPH
jgi:hypothetical protein